MASALAIQLAESGADPERLDELTLMLRDELLNLDVDNVEQVRDGEAPSGTRGLELAALGALLVTLNQSTDVVAHVVNTIREWLKRDPEPTRTVRVTLGDRTIELSAASNEQQDRLVAEFVRASGGGKDGR
jgi:Flp pilus assembly CpaE family ATPase